MIRTRSQNNKLRNNNSNTTSKLGVCNKCHNSIKNEDDMYKIHKTGDTVCKSCWKNMNICTSEAEIQVQQNVSETKLCTVFLKDVLKDTDIKEQKLYKINEDDVGNKTYVVTGQNVTNENKPDKVVKDTRRQGQKRSLRSVKLENEDINDKDIGPNKKHKSDEKEASNTDSKEESLPRTRRVRQLQQKNSTHSATQSSDSDSSVSRVTRKGRRVLTKHKLATGSSWSDADVDNRQDRKKLKTILKGIPIAKSIQVSDVSSSNEDVMSRKKRLRFTSASPTMIDEIQDNKALESSARKVSTRKIKNLSGQSPKLSMEKIEESQSESDHKEVIFDTKTYVCDECGASYENKLLGLTHKLSHYKQPTLKLQKLSEESSVIEKESGPSEPVDNLSEDPSESIALMVEDDEEESVEHAKNLNENNFTDISSNEESKICSPRKEAVEDAVDVKLVMKESDDDQLHKTQKEGEELQADEDVEMNVASSSTQNENEVTKDEDIQKESKEDENVNLEENLDTSQSFTEHKQKQHKEEEEEEEKEKEEKDEENEQDGNKDKLDEEEIEQVVSLGNINEDHGEKDIEKKEEMESTSKTMEADNDRTEEEENDRTQEEENDKTQDEENDKTQDEENDKTQDEEKNNSKDIKEGEGQDIEKEEEQHVKTTDKDTEEEDTVCESLNKSIKDSADSTVNVDEVDSVKEVEQENTEMKEVDRTIDDASNSKETSEQKSPRSTQKVKSPGENIIQTKINGSPKQSKVLEEIELVNEMDNSRGAKSTSDSANAVAEVLQEVLDLANAEVRKRQEVIGTNAENDTIELETLENISREINSTIDMPCLKINDDDSTDVVCLE
ncbi:hypothetical protein WH47_10881 [Habropoda laboriosa]|uniref:C2H2-type domain-containing protein n=2 Tax=Habropoda laboriosa TaxID=597456 RepID=A0A0L7RDG7_9HYME|nr:hypothetical protein WH47_10881 [Habropoda laboriosa]